MKIGLKWAAYGLSAVVAMAAAAAAFGLWRSASLRTALAPLPATLAGITIPDDNEARARGRYLYQSRGCIDCHGANGAGRFVIDDGAMRISGSNLTPGPGSAVAGYAPLDWVRAIRHGVKRDGTAAMVMPSEDYNRLTDADLGALVAYIRSLPPATGPGAVVQLPLPVRLIHGFGGLPSAYSKIDHTQPPSLPVAEAVSVEHGAYVAEMCQGCHAKGLVGGRIPGGPPEWPEAPRLAGGPGSVMPRYASADVFIAMIKTGKRPDGSAVQVMPFDSLRNMNDVDLRALHLFLVSLNR